MFDVTILYIIGPKTRYVCLFICMLPMAGRTAGPIKTKLGIGTHVDPGSVSVKVKVNVIYLCVWYNRICLRHLANNNEACAKYQQQ